MMAGSTVTLSQVNSERLLAKIENIGSGAGIDFTRLWPTVKLMLSSFTKRNFDRGQAPDGTAWLPLKRARTRNRRKGDVGLPLRDTGKLLASNVGKAEGHYEKEMQMSLEWGTNIDYAEYHQDGTRTIPARSFLGWNEELADDVAAAIQDFIADKVT